MTVPFDHLGENLERALSGWNVALYAGGVASTAALSASGGDHELRVAVQEHLAWHAGSDATVIGGYVLSPLVPGFLYVTGLATGEEGLGRTGAAGLQALGVTLMATFALKVGTGRPFPLHGGSRDAPDRLDHPEYAEEWAPLGFRGRYAWPSGHTSAAFAVAAAFTAESRSLAVALASYPVAAGIGFGMLSGDHHFASDVLAGALLGQGVGWSVGVGFRGPREEDPRLMLVPLAGEVRGAALTGVW